MSRTLDALVAEKVMGLSVVWTDHDEPVPFIGPWRTEHLAGEKPRQVADLCPEYSTSIAAAWEVVEKVSGPENRNFNVGRRSYPNGLWKASFHWRDGTHDPVYGEADTAPLAIVLAALRAHNVPLPGGEGEGK